MLKRKTILDKVTPKPTSPSEVISAFLGKETVFEGKMTFEGVFRLEGKFEGEIFNSGTLILGETAVVKGKVEVNTIIINGSVEGEIFVKDRVEIHPTGKVFGTIFTPILIVNEGGILEGHCKMEGVQRKEENLQVLSHQEDHLTA
ncbi:MAG: bactofilin family protein [Thermodesulfobacteriota bacterium]